MANSRMRLPRSQLAPEPPELCGRRYMRRPGTLPLAAVRAWLMQSWICPRCRPVRAWRPLSRAATANRSSACGSGPRTPSRVRLALPRYWTPTYRQTASRAPVRTLTAELRRYRPLPRAVLIRASSCHRPGRPSPGAWALWPTGRALPSAATGPRNSGDGHKAAQPTAPLHQDEPRGDAAERRPRPARSTAAPGGQMGWTCSAWGPLAPWPAVNSTRWSSWRLR